MPKNGHGAKFEAIATKDGKEAILRRRDDAELVLKVGPLAI
jgi:hypothetical protein